MLFQQIIYSQSQQNIYGRKIKIFFFPSFSHLNQHLHQPNLVSGQIKVMPIVHDQYDIINLIDSKSKIKMDKPSFQVGIKQKMANTAVKWSPHAPNLLALGSAQNFSVVGKGLIQIKRIEANSIQTVAHLNEKDAVFDISWFQLNDKFILIGSGSGETLFWEIGKGIAWGANLKAEVQSVQCAYKTPLFIAGCNNGFIHLGNCQTGKVAFQIPGHAKNCNQIKWHPTSEKVFASGGGDGLLKMWDHTLPKPNISSHRAHDAQILSLDFNKYEEQIVTCSIDKSIRVWDLRKLVSPVNILMHHRYPPKKVRFSPHTPWLLASGSFDMNVHFYDLRDTTQPLKMKGAQHTEFVSGVQFNLFEQKQVCSIGWDGRLLVWDWDKPQPVVM